MRWALALALLGCAPRHVPAEMPPEPPPPEARAPAPEPEPPEPSISRRELDGVDEVLLQGKG